jgi:enoyl-CoA hydratase/carnithine racemase
MEERLISLTKREDVAVLTLARPPVNAINEPMLQELEEAYQRIRADETVRSVVVRSAQRFFSPGVDIAMIHSLITGSDTADSLLAFNRRLQRFYAMWAELGLVTIAAVEGTATGGGLEFALACDLRVASRDATVGLPEAKIGLLPGAGGTQRLTRIAGLAAATRMILTGELVSGAEAERLGIVHKAVERHDVEPQAFQWAGEVAALPRTTVAEIKRCLALAPSEAGFAAEIDGTGRVLAAPDSHRLIERFLERHAGHRETMDLRGPDTPSAGSGVPVAAARISGHGPSVVGR